MSSHDNFTVMAISLSLASAASTVEDLRIIVSQQGIDTIVLRQHDHSKCESSYRTSFGLGVPSRDISTSNIAR